jgi:hypothetical protein
MNTTTTQSAIGTGPYRIVARAEAGGLVRKDFATRAELIACVVSEMGGALRGLSPSGRTRPQLWNQPQFSNFFGPMWDGDAIRYESTEAYAILSV